MTNPHLHSRNGPRVRTLFLALLFLSGSFVTAELCGGGAVSSDPKIWIGPDGQPLPFTSDTQILEFLETAEVISTERVGTGINKPYKLALERNGVRAHAVFRDVHVWKREAQLGNELKFLFRDDAIFEVAAYRLAGLLGLTRVPPAVERTLMGKRGSLQLWLEAAFSDKDRLEKGLKPTNLTKWRCEYQAMLMFDALIGNEDRNQGNILFDSDWSRWLIDHTRAFRTEKTLLYENLLKQCPEETWKRLQNLDLELLQANLSDYLTPRQIRSILQRCDLLVAHYQSRIDKWGEAAVLVRTEF